jgi:hypothetical protein
MHTLVALNGQPGWVVFEPPQCPRELRGADGLKATLPVADATADVAESHCGELRENAIADLEACADAAARKRLLNGSVK